MLKNLNLSCYFPCLHWGLLDNTLCSCKDHLPARLWYLLFCTYIFISLIVNLFFSLSFIMFECIVYGINISNTWKEYESIYYENKYQWINMTLRARRLRWQPQLYLIISYTRLFQLLLHCLRYIYLNKLEFK